MMITIEELIEEWNKDCPLNLTDLAQESDKTARLHGKYLNYLEKFQKELRENYKVVKKLERLKFKYYTGKLDIEELKKLNWTQFPFQLSTKDEIKLFIESDEMYDKYFQRQWESEQKVKHCESILDQIKNRGFIIGHAKDWIKLTT